MDVMRFGKGACEALHTTQGGVTVPKPARLTRGWVVLGHPRRAPRSWRGPGEGLPGRDIRGDVVASVGTTAEQELWTRLTRVPKTLWGEGLLSPSPCGFGEDPLSRRAEGQVGTQWVHT